MSVDIISRIPVKQIDLGKSMDYIVTKLVFDDGSIKYRVCHLEKGFNSFCKDVLLDDIFAVVDYIVNK